MTRPRFPYGISNFKVLATEGYHYVDRTEYIAKMEQMDSKYHFFLRPRRFGKSLAVSVMEYYYGKQHRADFDLLFGRYYLGQHPTPGANAYLVLKFDFSGIETSSLDQVTSTFLAEVKIGIRTMMGQYRDLFDEDDLNAIEAQENAGLALSKLLEIVKAKHWEEKIILLIDEYDHFTNEIIAFHFDNFQKIVSRNGFVRKFFEMVKKGTQSGIIDRIFITGVSPVTLDSLTSGFNIGTNLSLNPVMHDFMGFTEAEVMDFIRFAGVPEEKQAATMDDLRSWYNGYLFSEFAANLLYNPDMVLYFAMQYAQLQKYPRTLLDINISSDYGKIRRMFNVGNMGGNYEVLEEIMKNGSITATITEQFSFERSWTRGDFISLLFYMGLLTIREASFGSLVFQAPNHVIGELYYKFFQEIILERSNLKPDDLRVTERVISLARDNDIQPLKEALDTVLKNLDNRDARRLDEKHVKMALMALLVPTGVYSVYSEYTLGQEYADIVMFRRPPIMEPKRQYIFELKYLKKGEENLLPEVAEEGRSQLRRYLSHPTLARHDDFTAFLWVVVGYEVKLLEEIT